jgi:hypothetical protein
MKIHRIDPDPSPIVREACQQMEVAEQTVQATLELYKRKGFIPPWTGYLAEKSGHIVGTCGFAGPPQNGEDSEKTWIRVSGNHRASRRWFDLEVAQMRCRSKEKVSSCVRRR